MLNRELTGLFHFRAEGGSKHSGSHCGIVFRHVFSKEISHIPILPAKCRTLLNRLRKITKGDNFTRELWMSFYHMSSSLGKAVHLRKRAFVCVYPIGLDMGYHVRGSLYRKLRASLDEEPVYSRVLASWRERLYG